MLLVVGGTAPDSLAADPAVRLVGRLLADLAGRLPVALVTTEVRAEVHDALSWAGVAITRAVDVAAELRARTEAPAAILVLDPGGPASLALAAVRADGGPLAEAPLVALVAAPLASVAAVGDIARPDAHHVEGHDRWVSALADAERTVLADADVVLCATTHGADDVRSLLAADGGAGVPTVRALERTRSAGPAPWPWSERAGIAVPGRWHAQAGRADLDGLTALADAVARSGRAARDLRPVRVVGLDGVAGPLAPARRLAPRPTPGLLGPVPAGRLPATWHDGRTWGEALAWSRVVLLPAGWGPADPLLIDDVVAAGVPLVGTPAVLAGGDLGPVEALVRCADHDELVARAIELVTDRAAWTELADGLADLAARRPNAPTLLDQVLDALADLGLDVPGEPRTTPPAASLTPLVCRAVPRPAGTLAAASPAAEAHEVALGLGWRFRRHPEGLRAQLGLDDVRRERRWQVTHEESAAELERLRSRPPRLHRQPTVSLLVPCHRTPVELLDALVASVRAQTYPRWELVLVDDASGDAALTARLAELAAEDARIVVGALDDNAGIAGATNAALGLASGELVALLDHDDELHPAALLRVLERWDLEPDLDAVYTDEDKLDADGNRCQAHRKPDLDPDLLLGINYVNHLTVVRRSLLDELGGWRSGFDGSQDLDLWLRLTEHTERVGHVARPLYHWRTVSGSTAADADAKSDAGPNGRRAVADALERRRQRGEVTEGALPTWHRVRWHHDERPLVSVIVPTRDRGDMVRAVVDGIAATTDHPWQLVLVDNASTDPASLATFAELEADGATVVRYPHDFHFARQVDLGIAAADGPLCLVLNNDTEITQPGWLDELVGQALRPEVGAVGLRLRRPTGIPQHEGIVLGVGGVAWNLDSGTHGEWGQAVRDCSAVTAAAVLCRTEVLRAVGGFDDGLRVAFNDVDLCLRISAMGWRVVYTPWAELGHEESASRGSLHPQEDDDRFVVRWGGERDLRDPLWNVSLDMINADNLVL